MAFIETVTLDVADTTAADRFYSAAFGLDTQLRLRASQAPAPPVVVRRLRPAAIRSGVQGGAVAELLGVAVQRPAPT